MEGTGTFARMWGRLAVVSANVVARRRSCGCTGLRTSRWPELEDRMRASPGNACGGPIEYYELDTSEQDN